MRGARAHRCGEAAFVTCYEVIGDSLLAATNIFVLEDGGWKLVHHQAGPCNLPPADLPKEEERPLQSAPCGRRCAGLVRRGPRAAAPSSPTCPRLRPLWPMRGWRAPPGF